MDWAAISEWANKFGPWALWAIAATAGCVHLYRNHRDDARDHAAALKQIATEFAAKLDTKESVHHQQVTEVTDRFVELYKEVATENRELTHEIRTLIEVVSKKRR